MSIRFHFDHLEAFLRGEDPVPGDVVEFWQGVTPSAQR